MPHASLLFAVLMLATPQASSDPISWSNPVDVHLMSVVDHADVLGGQRVHVAAARVVRVLGPRLVVVGEPRVRGFDHTHDPWSRLDKLLVFLPSDSTFARGQTIALTGVVRTVAGAQAAGVNVDEQVAQADGKKNPKKKDDTHRGRWNSRPILVADSADTVAPGSFAGGR